MNERIPGRTEIEPGGSVLHRRVAIGRDGAVVVSGGIGTLLMGLSETWLLMGLAAASMVVWIVVRRTGTQRAGDYLFIAFVVIGLALVWRFAEQRLWLSWAGMLLLVTAMDLDRLWLRFPTGSRRELQSRVVKNHLVRLTAVAVAGGVVTSAGLLLSLELQLIAVMLLAVFVVLVLIQFASGLQQRPTRPQDDDSESS